MIEIPFLWSPFFWAYVAIGVRVLGWLHFWLFMCAGAIGWVVFHITPWSELTFYAAVIIAVYLVNCCTAPPNVERVSGTRSAVALKNQRESSSSGGLISRITGLKNDHEQTNLSSASTSKLEDRGADKFHGKNVLPNDTLSWTTSRAFLYPFKTLITLFGYYHALMSLHLETSDISTPLCRNPENRHMYLFTWSSTSVALLSLLTTCAVLRLQAFHQIGKYSTSNILPPSYLTTTGLYAYMQHPAYTFGALTFLFYSTFFLHAGGVISCWVDHDLHGTKEWWMIVGLFWIVVGAGLKALMGRVAAEEALLKREFGEEWVRWSSKTKRFIPGIW